ncbi:ABC transporter permease [Alginatibacterium sediminis]|uniref:ABC transporter permease n=1 Tax=Alginatibacterium sediminis TaxID=2164068 RepID=A0A420E771_9ALTE|nr:ABC transporter permease [Alginatibacterium sediminis]RKF14258.1 ABC transporter permease [Alginatibacterium sediminis]
MGFILRRLFFYLAAFMVAVVINFMLPRLMPGDPVTAMLGGRGAMMTYDQIEALRQTFGFVDGPLIQQFFSYVSSVFQGDLGTSVQSFPETVSTILGRAFGWTLFLTGAGTLLAFIVGSLLGILAAWNRGGWFDSIVSPLSLILQATPQLVFGLLFMFVFGVTLQWLPSGYAFSPELTPEFSWLFISDVAAHAILPVFTVFIVQLGGFLIPMRNNMINLLNEDYITMGKAKGLSQLRVMLNYGARNAVLPSVTSLSMALGMVIGGAMVVEVIFNYPGLGTVLYNAILARDYQLIQGQLLVMTLFMLFFNFMADILYLFLDPRLKHGGSA